MTEEALSERVAALLAADSVPITRERKGRQEQDDLRPSVLALAVGRGPSGLPSDVGPSGETGCAAPVAVVGNVLIDMAILPARPSGLPAWPTLNTVTPWL